MFPRCVWLGEAQGPEETSHTLSAGLVETVKLARCDNAALRRQHVLKRPRTGWELAGRAGDRRGGVRRNQCQQFCCASESGNGSNNYSSNHGKLCPCGS